MPGFNYSAALKAKGGNWTFDDLDHFIANPKAWLPGTNMGFAGLARGGQRADLINYLHTLSDNPVPLPEGGGSRAARAGGREEIARRVSSGRASTPGRCPFLQAGTAKRRFGAADCLHLICARLGLSAKPS